MVNSAYCFPQAEYSTPHGGKPFHGWKKGHGFGKGAAAGMLIADPSIPMQLKYTPKGDRGFSASSFWRRKSEVGQACGFGIGDRPDYGKENDGKIAPNAYGDVSKKINNIRKNYTRRGLTLSPYYMTMQDKFVLNGEPGPGPAKYNTASKTGQSSLVTPAKIGSFTMGGKPMFDKAVLQRMEEPGPGEYNVQTKAGKNAPHLRGTTQDISLHLKFKRVDENSRSPGPSRYFVRGDMDKYTLGTMIKNVKLPKGYNYKDGLNRSSSSPVLHSAAADEFEFSREDACEYDEVEAPTSTVHDYKPLELM